MNGVIAATEQDYTEAVDAHESHAEAFAVVLTEDEAARLVERLTEARKRVEARKASAQAWVEEAVKRAESLEAWALPQLEKFFDANAPRKGKTLRLPTGALSKRTVPGGVRVVDKGALIEWAQIEGVKSVLSVKEVVSVDSAAVVAYVEGSGGELPPGVEMVAAREAFDVKGG